VLLTLARFIPQINSEMICKRRRAVSVYARAVRIYFGVDDDIRDVYGTKVEDVRSTRRTNVLLERIQDTDSLCCVRENKHALKGRER
jgi:hypothetical protein